MCVCVKEDFLKLETFTNSSRYDTGIVLKDFCNGEQTVKQPE